MNIKWIKTIGRPVATKALIMPEKQSMSSIIEEIHDTFYTEVDKLLKEANILNSTDTDKQDIIDKRNKLVNLGFNKTKEVEEANIEIDRISKLAKENDSKEKLIRAIKYFSSKYPLYKFITEDSVLKICNKYGLVYGDVDRYIGTVPDRNLDHIANFKVDEDDKCYVEDEFILGIEYTSHKLISYDDYKKGKQVHNSSFRHRWFFNKCNLEIAAPQKDFNIKGMEVKDFKLSKIEIKDPVVLHPVFFEGDKHYLIVTAWGVEASDELIINENFN